jgi:superfamily II DNA/RNA helicase
MDTEFSSLGLGKALLRGLMEIGFTNPTQV